MPEFEELRLKIIVDDQASAQLSRLRAQFGQMGSNESQQGFERIRTNASALNPIMRTVASGSLSARSAMTIMTGVMGGAGAAVAGLGFAFVNQAQRLKAFTQGIVDIDTKARALGIDGGALDNVLKQMRRMGVENNRAIPFIEGVTKGIASISTQGSQINQFINTHIKTGENRERMNTFLSNMTGFAQKKDLESQLEEFVASANYVYTTAFEETKNEQQARETWRTYLRAFGVDPETTLLVPENYSRQTDEEKKEYDSSLNAARAYNTEYNALSEQFKGFNTSMKTAMLPAFTEINKMFASGEIDAQAWGQIFGTTIANELRDVMGIIKAIQAVMNWADRVDQKVEVVVKRGEEFQQMSGADIAARARRGRQPQETAAAAPVVPEVVIEQGGGESEIPTPPPIETGAKEGGGVLSKIGRWFGKRQGGGAVAGGQPYMVGEGGPELFVPQGGGTILPGFGGAGAGSGLLREQIDEMRDNTEMVNQSTTLMRDLAEEFKQLNDFLQPKGETGQQPEARQYGGSAYKGRRYLVGERGPERFLQRGGRAAGKRPVVVGEKGPEIFVPDTSGEVISNNQAINDGLMEERGLPTYGLETREFVKGGPSASLRNNNPGAQWPGSQAGLFGGETKKSLENRLVKNANLVKKGAKDPYDYISFFPTPVHGLASNMETFYRRHLGKPLVEAMGSWSGGLRKGAELEKYGYDAGAIVTEEMINDANFWIAMTQTESGKKGIAPSREQLAQAAEMRRLGSAEAYEAAGGMITEYTTEGKRIIKPEINPFAGGGGEFGGGGVTSAFDSAELDRSEVDNMMGGEITTVKGKGNIDVKIGGNGGARRNGNGQHLLKDIKIERPTQMQPAEAGPTGTDTTAETA